jgi:hypothetical protein
VTKPDDTSDVDVFFDLARSHGFTLLGLMAPAGADAENLWGLRSI